MICKECGAKIDDNSAVCEFCGAVYSVDVPAVEPETDIPLEASEEKDETEKLFDENEAKRRVQMERIRAEKQSKLDEIEKRRQEKKRRQTRNRLLAIILSLLCGAAVGVGAYYISMGSDDADDVVIVTPRPTVDVTQTPEATPTPEPTPTSEATATATPAATATVAPTAATVPSSSDKTTQSASKPKATAKPKVTAKPAAKAAAKPVSSGSDINSQLVTGGEVIKTDSQTYMTFKMNGNVYYAKVSDNTTSGFVSGKPMTVSASKTNETYNGNTVYKIDSITHYNGDYLLQNSGTALLTENDLAGMSAEQLRLARNEIYARHGRTFKDAELQNYFNSKSWYKTNSSYNYSNEYSNLNSTEKYNIKFITSFEEKVK